MTSYTLLIPGSDQGNTQDNFSGSWKQSLYAIYVSRMIRGFSVTSCSRWFLVSLYLHLLEDPNLGYRRKRLHHVICLALSTLATLGEMCQYAGIRPLFGTPCTTPPGTRITPELISSHCPEQHILPLFPLRAASFLSRSHHTSTQVLL